MHFNKNLAKDLMEHKGNSPLVNIENITLLDKEGKPVDTLKTLISTQILISTRKMMAALILLLLMD